MLESGRFESCFFLCLCLSLFEWVTVLIEKGREIDVGSGICVLYLYHPSGSIIRVDPSGSLVVIRKVACAQTQTCEPKKKDSKS